MSDIRTNHDAKTIAVSQYLADWLAHIRARVRAGTYEGYEGLIRRHAQPHFNEMALSQLRPLHLQRLYAHLLDGDHGQQLGAGTVLNLHLVLTQALGQAVKWQLLPSNPANGAQPPRPRRPPRTVVDRALTERLLKITRATWLETPAAVAIATGMRRGEILGLRWTDLDHGFTVAHVQRTLQPTRDGLVYEEPKTRRSRRVVALPAFLRPHLKRQHAEQTTRHQTDPSQWHEHGLVIDRGNGQPLNPDTLSAGWARHLQKHNLPQIRFHDLRHAHATLMLTKGVHPKIVSERLGHASISITLDLYSHVLPSLQTEAAAAFDQLFPALP